ncbi:hypothetical protein [Armatimonas sp.]|uniref:hypothetical protein n=1 Tax=Armatimonas sp. TaxID=1872638 RepID=UPI003752B115
MTGTSTDLDRIALAVQEAQDSAGFAWQLTQRYQRATTDDARAELVTLASAEAKKATHAAREALESLQDAGAVLPDKGAAPVKPSNPLAELSRVESSRSEALALLDALRHALTLAEALDAKRGDVLDVPVGGSAGLVWGDRVLQAVCGLELELYGPGEAVTGARE